MAAAKDRKIKKSQQAVREHHQQNGHGAHFKLAKLFDRDATWDKDELADVLHWIRQGMGLLCGLIWGAVPLVGAIWIAVFLGISTTAIYWYYAYFLKADEEDYGGHGALLQEGLFASFTLFLLAWILVYSLVHF